MKTPLKTLIAALAVTATVIPPLAVTPVAADEHYSNDYPGSDNGRAQWRRDRYHDRDDWRRHQRRYPPRGTRLEVRRHDDSGAAAAAAIIGLAAGAIAAGALSQSNNPPIVNRRVYGSPYPPAPAGPRVITLDESYEPWTASWYQWCDANYRTFNPKTGTFHGYDGRDHFCTPH